MHRVWPSVLWLLLGCTSGTTVSALSIGPDGDPGPAGPTGDTGKAGATGPLGGPGESAVSLAFGDGSSGELHVTTYVKLSSLAVTSQFTSVSIDAGGMLEVDSGSVLRCTGTFSNAGSVAVNFVQFGASAYGGHSHPSVAGVRAAAGGFISAPGVYADGGPETPAVPRLLAQQLVIPHAGGGDGAAGLVQGGQGGGAVTILARGALTNSGEISAFGRGYPVQGVGGGGGAGGIVVLASSTSVTNTGTIDVHGGDGGGGGAAYSGTASGTVRGAGGGGGGGIVNMLAPLVTQNGNVVLSGGAAGSSGGAATVYFAYGGGAGGSCGGKGGQGQTIYMLDPPPSAWDVVPTYGASAGGNGVFLARVVDPVGLW